MSIFDKLRSRRETAFVRLDAHNCVACWDCVKACPKVVIGKVKFLGHKHAKIVNAEACIGCMKCVRTCPHDCFISLK